LETFKSKKTGSSFYPGKGMRDHGKSRGCFRPRVGSVAAVAQCSSLVSPRFP
jgi:hypothetical protein